MAPRTCSALLLFALACDSTNSEAPKRDAPSPSVVAEAPATAPATPPATSPANPPPSTPPVPDPSASIGSARMEADGTIVLQLRAETGAAVGDALLRYPPDHADYAAIRGHVGAIEPGQERPVAPFPDKQPTRRYRVSRGHEVLGTIEVRPGEPGTLTLTSESDAAQQLAEMWRDVEKQRSFSISMHVPTSDGSRGAYGARIYRVEDDDYAQAVQWKLLDANYTVDVLGP